MRCEIPFNEIMKNHKNWHDECDFDVMSENFMILKPIMKLLFFAEMPEHPELFSLVFSEKGFAKKLVEIVGKLKMKEVKRIWFTEYNEELRNQLIKKGILELIPNLFGATSVCYMCNDDKTELFVNLIL